MHEDTQPTSSTGDVDPNNGDVSVPSAPRGPLAITPVITAYTLPLAVRERAACFISLIYLLFWLLGFGFDLSRYLFNGLLAALNRLDVVGLSFLEYLRSSLDASAAHV